MESYLPININNTPWFLLGRGQEASPGHFGNALSIFRSGASSGRGWVVCWAGIQPLVVRNDAKGIVHQLYITGMHDVGNEYSPDLLDHTNI